MVKLISDSSCLYTPIQAKELGFIINPLTVTINNKQYNEFEDISTEEFLNIINAGYVPTSSQPSLGRLTEELENCDEDCIVLSMAEGLSGTYQTALLAKNSIEKNEKIHVINTKTLCGPHRHIVEISLQMIKNNETIENIIKTINEKIETVESFLLPQDFNYLKRGGRLTPIAATLAGLLKIQPIIKQTKDGKKLDKFGISRNFKIAINKIIEFYKPILNKKYKVYISHAFNIEEALYIKDKFLKEFPEVTLEILELSCAFITQGGPKCIAIQSIKAY